MFRKERNRDEILEEEIKKLTEKLADTDNIILDREDFNEERFRELEEKIGKLFSALQEHKQNSELKNSRVQEELYLTKSVQDKLIEKVDKLQVCLDQIGEESEKLDILSIKDEMEKVMQEMVTIKDHVQQNSAMTMKDFTEVEMQFEKNEQILRDHLERINERLEKIEEIADNGNAGTINRIKSIEADSKRLQEKFLEMSNVMENVLEKMYEFESQKKNNLIFYGIAGEDEESALSLLHKVKEIIRTQLTMKRQVVVTRVSRMFTGPKVSGCRPVLVTFENFRDREDVLASSLVSMGRSGVTVTEDLSQKTREARQELRRFMREVRKINPEKRCFLKYDKLFIDGKMFVFSEAEGRVTEHSEAEAEQWRSMENLNINR